VLACGSVVGHCNRGIFNAREPSTRKTVLTIVYDSKTTPIRQAFAQQKPWRRGMKRLEGLLPRSHCLANSVVQCEIVCSCHWRRYQPNMPTADMCISQQSKTDIFKSFILRRSSYVDTGRSIPQLHRSSPKVFTKIMSSPDHVKQKEGLNK
jgi:hypothetical protein